MGTGGVGRPAGREPRTIRWVSFCRENDAPPALSGGGALDRLGFGDNDLFRVEGSHTGFGFGSSVLHSEDTVYSSFPKGPRIRKT